MDKDECLVYVDMLFTDTFVDPDAVMELRYCDYGCEIAIDEVCILEVDFTTCKYDALLEMVCDGTCLGEVELACTDIAGVGEGVDALCKVEALDLLVWDYVDVSDMTTDPGTERILTEEDIYEETCRVLA